MKLNQRLKAILKKEPEPKPSEGRAFKVSRSSGRGHQWPLRLLGATPSVISRMAQDLNSGDLELFLSIAHELEERDTHYGAVIGTRKNAAVQLPWTIDTEHMKLDDGTMTDADMVIVEDVQSMVDSGWWRPMLLDCLDGLGKGFSTVEIMWKQDGPRWVISGCEWRDQRYFIFDEDTGEQILIKNAGKDQSGGAAKGRPLPPNKFIVHFPRLLSGKAPRGALARPVAILHMLRSIAVIDWAALLEIFGQPFRIGYYPPGASDDYKAELQDALFSMGSDAAAIIAEGSKVDFVEAGVGAAGTPGAIYDNFLRWCDEQVSKICLGQTMTTDSGSSRAQAEVHETVQRARRDYDAQMLADSVQRQLIEPYVRLNYGPDANVPIVRPETDDPDDLQTFANAITPMIDRGLKVSSAWVLDKFGAPDLAAGEAYLVPVASSYQKDDDADPDADDGDEAPTDDSADSVDDDDDSAASDADGDAPPVDEP